MSKLTDEHKQRLLRMSRKPSTASPDTKLETVKEFLERGGEITVAPKPPDMMGSDAVLPALSYRKAL